MLGQAIVFSKDFNQPRGRFPIHHRVLLADDLKKKFKLSPTDFGLVIDVALSGDRQICPDCKRTKIVLTKKGEEVKKLFDDLNV